MCIGIDRVDLSLYLPIILSGYKSTDYFQNYSIKIDLLTANLLTNTKRNSYLKLQSTTLNEHASLSTAKDFLIVAMEIRNT